MADIYKSCAVLLLMIVLTYDGFLLALQAQVHPSPDFSRHTTITPKIYHGREKRQISITKEEDGKHTHYLSITYNINDKDYILDLQLNTDLIPKGYFTRYQQNGKNVVNRLKGHEMELCQYQGKIRDVPNSWVALSTCKEGRLSGVVYDGHDMHYIENSDDKHFLYKHSDIIDSYNKTCGYQQADHHHPEPNRILRYKRGTEVKGPYNSNRQSRYVELVLVVDNTEYKEMGENIGQVEEHCKNIANIMNGLYSSLNIFIALVGIVVWTERDEVTFSSNGDTTLTNFLHYRRETLIKEHPNDNAQLLTKFTFEHGVVGKALKGPMCTIEYSGGVNTDHSPIVGLVATTIAHEMGHNFGMEHDTSECVCPDDRCIMAPSSSNTPPKHWSSCSLEYLALAFEHGMDYCLRNKPTALYDSPICGNGFVEHGEQCDCGLPEHCDNTCCNAITCTLFTNATCATGECCDLQKCRPKPAATLCRSAEYECDLPEYCTGESEFCPADIYKMDTEICDDGRAYCYKGLCRTRSDQCKLLWGETGRSSDNQCYALNVKGTRHGNCGYNKLNQSFAKCRDEDIMCGMLHCKHLNERLEFGMESVAILSHSFINVKGSVVPCRSAIVDLGINQMDPGLTPDGATCGEEKMCVNQKCLSVASLRASGKVCDGTCNGHGVCNSLGHCHCEDGFAPPFCDYPGFGGSEDSGPTSDPNARKDFVIALFVIFLGVLPALAIIGFLLYYTKHNLCLTLKKTASPPPKKSPQKPRGITPFQASIQPKRPEDNSLLQDKHEESPPAPGFKHEFFGNFKGFSLTPLKQPEPEPVRPAPPVPTVIVKRSATTITSSQPPALPPLNQGSQARPIISSPILENSTCTAKELLSPLKNAPKIPMRPAPERPLSTPNSIMVATIMNDDIKKHPKESTLNRIASFLKSEKPSTVIKVSKVLDKNTLRGIEISNPILQSEIAIPTASVDLAKPVVMRAQSMRGTNVTKRPEIPNFGSMRHSNKRPVSIPAANRPKSPPPPRPPPVKVPALPGYHKPSAKTTHNEYDDCLNSDKTPTSDNIYAVIDETPVISPETVSGSSENVSLLGEIVTEIHNRNEDSIYSTSTLGRKKAENEAETYVNTSSIYKVPENSYSNMDNFKSSASSTSSGYIAPSAINAPVKQEIKPYIKPTLSTFKSGPVTTKPSIKFKIPPSPMVKSPVKPLNKQLSGGNLRNSIKQATPVRVTPPPSNNSPDLVTSCSGENNSKSPDVLNTSAKRPNIPKKISLPGKATKLNTDIKKGIGRNNSNVAALQQKFENKPTIGARTVSITNKK